VSVYTDFDGIFPIPDGRGGVWGWCTVGTLVWEVGIKGSGLFVTVPDGFVSDLASIPRWLHWLLNPYDPQTVKAAIVHDWLTPDDEERSLPGYMPEYRPLWNQRTSAGEFYAALRADGMGRFRANLYFNGVLLGMRGD
jgi:hypothetical protein